MTAHHACFRCRRPFAPREVRHVFALMVQAEADLEGGDAPDEPSSPEELLARMEAEGDWDRYAAEVHTERSGSLCTACKDVLLMLLDEGSAAP